jgi:hypothetical protein
MPRSWDFCLEWLVFMFESAVLGTVNEFRSQRKLEMFWENTVKPSETAIPNVEKALLKTHGNF